jgi:hypothetical protein
MRLRSRGERRRRTSLRRRFFSACTLLLMPLFVLPKGVLRAQDERAARILARQARLTRDQAGDIRMVESLLVAIEGVGEEGVALSEPLAVVRLQEAVDEVRGLGGDISLGQLVFDPPHLTVVGPAVPGEFQVVFTYALTSDAAEVEMAAMLPVDTLIVEIQRGSVEASPDPLLVARGEGGPEARPYRRYVTEGLPAERVVTVELIHGRVDWRSRLAVLLATTFAAGAAAVWVWRRSSGTGRTVALAE